MNGFQRVKYQSKGSVKENESECSEVSAWPACVASHYRTMMRAEDEKVKGKKKKNKKKQNFVITLHKLVFLLFAALKFRDLRHSKCLLAGL